MGTIHLSKNAVERQYYMELESRAYPGMTEPPRPTISARTETQPAKPKRKRVKKTLDQQVAETEERLKKLKAKQRSEERAKRNHRLIASAATIEAEAGHIELDERIAAWLGRVLANEIASKPEGEIARYIARRDGKGDKQ